MCFGSKIPNVTVIPIEGIVKEHEVNVFLLFMAHKCLLSRKGHVSTLVHELFIPRVI